MKLEVKRRWFTGKSTIGELWVNGERFSFTLEPETREDEVKPRAIPEGVYGVEIGWSPRHQRMIPIVEGVPGFVGIEIHVGNFPRDTEGCLLVGGSKGEDEVGESAAAFSELFALMERARERGEAISIAYSAAVREVQAVV